MCRFAAGANYSDRHLDFRVKLTVGNGDVDVEHFAAPTDQRLVEVDDAGVGIDPEGRAVVLAFLGGTAVAAIRFDAEREDVIWRVECLNASDYRADFLEFGDFPVAVKEQRGRCVEKVFGGRCEESVQTFGDYFSVGIQLNKGNLKENEIQTVNTLNT